MKRRLIESIEHRKDAMIAALWSNPNLDDGKDTRSNAIAEIEGNFEEAVAKILGVAPPDEEDIDKDNPFFQAAERGMKKLEKPRNDEGTVQEVVEYEADIDQ